MADANFTLLDSPDFPQVFAAAIDRLVDRCLGVCWYDDGNQTCSKPGTVHQLGTDYDFCLDHFKKVTRG